MTFSPPIIRYRRAIGPAAEEVIPMAQWKERILVNPDILVGKPIIKSTRISVKLILDRVADGWSMDDILTAYTHVCRDDVLAALSFAAKLFKEETFVAVGKLSPLC